MCIMTIIGVKEFVVYSLLRTVLSGAKLVNITPKMSGFDC